MKGIEWRKNINEAIEEVSGGTRLPMIFFHRKECVGSRKTISELFNDKAVTDLVEKETAPIKVDVAESEKLARKYHIDWTPAFVVVDEQGEELEKWVGYLPKRDFMAQLILSKGLAALHLNRLDEAKNDFNELIEGYTGSELVPEAEYFLGITGFKETGDEYKLGEACRMLSDKYPESQWTKRCSVWSHIQPESRRPFVTYSGGGGPGTY
jgi:TolA-binding protein